MAQWKFYEHLTFPALIQKIERTARSICYTGIATVFMESKHVLPKKIPKDSDFAGLNLAIALDEKEAAHAIISHFYKSNIQIRHEGQLGPYHKADLTVLWFVNTVGCRWRPILTCFMQASAFTMSCRPDCYDNCIYKGDRNGDVPVYNIHDITARQFICYFDSKN